MGNTFWPKGPFVSGADTVIDRMVAAIPGAETGFTLVFSDKPFPSYQAAFEWRRKEYEGNWYLRGQLVLQSRLRHGGLALPGPLQALRGAAAEALRPVQG
jgi:hypothetical protein